MVFHRTPKSSWKSIAKNGLIPGGGDTVNSGRAHVYMSEHDVGTGGYRSGLRAKHPIVVKIAMKQAVQAGIIFSRTEMDGLLTSERIPPQFIVSIAEDKKTLWTRAESNLEPNTWQGTEKSDSSASKVELKARDDAQESRDIQMGGYTSSGQPDARQESTDVPMQSDQPPARVRRVYAAPKYCEPFTGTCPLCEVEYISGQVQCETCGYEPLPVDESGEIRQPANRRTKMLEQRMNKLAGFGMFGKVNGTLLAALTADQAAELRERMGSRGITMVWRALSSRTAVTTTREHSQWATRTSRTDITATLRSVIDGMKKAKVWRKAFLPTCLHSPIFPTLLVQEPKYQLASPPMPNINIA